MGIPGSLFTQLAINFVRDFPGQADVEHRHWAQHHPTSHLSCLMPRFLDLPSQISHSELAASRGRILTSWSPVIGHFEQERDTQQQQLFSCQPRLKPEMPQLPCSFRDVRQHGKEMIRKQLSNAKVSKTPRNPRETCTSTCFSMTYRRAHAQDKFPQHLP